MNENFQLSNLNQLVFFCYIVRLLKTGVWQFGPMTQNAQLENDVTHVDGNTLSALQALAVTVGNASRDASQFPYRNGSECDGKMQQPAGASVVPFQDENGIADKFHLSVFIRDVPD